jgi:large subunit ribosomal protein L7/L12
MAAITTDQILDAIASMTVLECSELVKAMEEKFGVTAAVAVAAAPAAGAAAGGEEQTEFTVTLDSFDAAKKIPVIKVVREITGLGLGEAKALVDGIPSVIKENVPTEQAKAMAEQLKAAGITVELK